MSSPLDLSALTEPCPRCSDLQVHLFHLNRVMMDLIDSRGLQIIGFPANEVGPEGVLCRLSFNCSKCRNTGHVLTPIGEKLVQTLSTWLK
jgi:hypothetical protein